MTDTPTSDTPEPTEPTWDPPARREGEDPEVYSLRVRHAYHVWMGSLSDGAFWDLVLNHVAPGDPPPDYEDPYQGTPGPIPGPSPCPVCGSLDACAYDEEGRPLIHTTPPDVDEDGDQVPEWWADTPYESGMIHLPEGWPISIPERYLRQSPA